MRTESMEKRSLKILAVEDDPTDELLLRRALEEVTAWGIELIVTRSAHDALAALAGCDDVGLVLMDYELGAETGLQALKRLRAAGHEMPVVFLTGRGDEMVAVEALQAGAADYLPKSRLSHDTLLRSIFFALEKRWIEKRVDQRRRELERTNVYLRQKNADMARFDHVISHELQTPLRSMKGLLSTLINGLSGPLTDMQMEYLCLVQSACGQMARCVDDLLDEEERACGTFRVEPRADSVQGVVEEVVQLMESTAAERSVWLRCEVDEGLPEAHMDRDRIAQVLRSLITDALESTREDGVVVVGVRPSPLDGAELQITVQDSGAGMAPDALDAVQEALEAEGRLDAEDEATLGIGLSVSREIVRAHGGALQVRSEAGRGTTVGFTLPVARTVAAAG